VTVTKPHRISCNSLTAKPLSGTLPLTVEFTADIVDSWNHLVNNYQWDFDYNGQFTSDRSTTTNQTSYTFTTSGRHTIAVKGITDSGANPSSCIRTVTITVNPWSSGNEREVAP